MQFTMKSLLAAVFAGAIAGHAIGAEEPAAAGANSGEASVEYVWFNGDDDAKSASLLYGNRESAEDLTLALNCKRGSGTVKLFAAETGEKLKRGQKTSLTLSAGTVKATANGKALPNEMAGGTSTEATLPASEPIFAAMTEAAGTLEIAVADMKIAVPLKGIGTKAADFAAACRK